MSNNGLQIAIEYENFKTNRVSAYYFDVSDQLFFGVLFKVIGLL